jgi:CRP-like cAMP-binding protein
MSCQLCLSNNPNCLVHCSARTIEQLNTQRVSHTFQVGDYLFHEGTEAEGLFCIKSGKVLIEKTRNQKVHPLRFLKQGYLLGMPAVFGHHKHFHAAKAISQVDACFVSKTNAYRLLETDPSFNKYVLLTLMQEMEELESRITRISEQTAEQRVAELLLDMQDTYGVEENGTLPLSVSFKFLATITNLSDRTLHKVIDMFTGNDWLKLEYGKASLINQLALKQLARGRLVG